MRNNHEMLSLAELRGRLRPFCEKHPIRRLEVFGSAARGEAGPGSDVDLLVTLDESSLVSTSDLLEMAGEAEELVGRPVDFVLRPSLEKSPNRYARAHIFSTAVSVYGGWPVPSTRFSRPAKGLRRRGRENPAGSRMTCRKSAGRRWQRCLPGGGGRTLE